MVLPVSVYIDCPVPTLLADGRVQQAEGQSWEEVGCSDPAAREGVKCSVKALNFDPQQLCSWQCYSSSLMSSSHTPIWYHLLILVFPISNKQSSDCGYKYFFLSLLPIILLSSCLPLFSRWSMSSVLMRMHWDSPGWRNRSSPTESSSSGNKGRTKYQCSAHIYVGMICPSNNRTSACNVRETAIVQLTRWSQALQPLTLPLFVLTGGREQTVLRVLFIVSPPSPPLLNHFASLCFSLLLRSQHEQRVEKLEGYIGTNTQAVNKLRREHEKLSDEIKWADTCVSLVLRPSDLP